MVSRDLMDFTQKALFQNSSNLLQKIMHTNYEILPSVKKGVMGEEEGGGRESSRGDFRPPKRGRRSYFKNSKKPHTERRSKLISKFSVKNRGN